jgi:serine/threonine protein kinase
MAVKVLRIPSNNKSVIVQELQREIDLMRSLNHPNIVQYLGAEVDTKNNILNIFQEWVAGGSVSSLLKKFGAFSPAVVRSYTTQILQGLDYLHSHHIIHRDIKVSVKFVGTCMHTFRPLTIPFSLFFPALTTIQGGNILISNDGSVKLADFGASKRVEAFGTDPDKMMEELTVRGTPYFMVRLPTYTHRSFQ